MKESTVEEMRDRERQIRSMHMRYPESEMNRPSIMLLRSLAHELGKEVSKAPGGYGGVKMERVRLARVLKENLEDSRLSEWDRDMIRGL